MANHYKLIIFLLVLFQSYIESFCNNMKDKNSLNYISQNNIISKKILMNKNPEEDSPIPKEKPPQEDIFKEYEILLEKDKELQESYNKYYIEFVEKNNQLKIDKIHISLLIIIACLLLIVIIIYSCYELYKYRENKNKSKIYGKSNSKIYSVYSFSKEFKSSQSTKSNEESFKKNSSYNPSQSGDLNNSSNFNIFTHDKENEDKKEKEIYVNLNELEEAPIENKEKNINNPNNNNFNDDMKTLTNDENAYFSSKTDKILYKPYSEEEINKK